MPFLPAERKQAKAKILLTGPAGSGKTWGALTLAKGLVGPDGRIAVIDTENSSAALYSHLVPFDTCVLKAPYSPENYIRLIIEAVDAGYDCLIIDSITHEWSGDGGILSIVDRLQCAQPQKWAHATPRHERFIEAMVQAPIHLIAACRTHTKWLYEQDEKGKTAPKKVGLEPQQREGMDYAFTTVFDIAVDRHLMTCSKDRTSLFADKDPVPITEDTAAHLLAWLDQGEPEESMTPDIVVPGATQAVDEEMVRRALAQEIKEMRARLGLSDKAAWTAWKAEAGFEEALAKMMVPELQALLAKMQACVVEEVA